VVMQSRGLGLARGSLALPARRPQLVLFGHRKSVGGPPPASCRPARAGAGLPRAEQNLGVSYSVHTPDLGWIGTGSHSRQSGTAPSRPSLESQFRLE